MATPGAAQGDTKALQNISICNTPSHRLPPHRIVKDDKTSVEQHIRFTKDGAISFGKSSSEE